MGGFEEAKGGKKLNGPKNSMFGYVWFIYGKP